jgi:hypothetical protein
VSYGLVSNRVTSPQATPRRAVTQVRRDGFPALRHANWRQLLRGFPELPVYEIGSKPAHECELFGLPGPDLLRTRLQGRKGLLRTGAFARRRVVCGIRLAENA